MALAKLNDDNKPVSVVMCSYNGELFIKDQIESILPNLLPDDQLLVSDDCSTDETINIVKSFKDKRIKLLISNNNIGYKQNFFNACIAARYNHIILADQDDFYFSNHFSLIKDKLNYGFDFCSTSFFEATEDLEPYKYVGHIENQNIRKRSIFLRIYKVIIVLLGGSKYFGCTIGFDRNKIKPLFTDWFRKKNLPHDLLISIICLSFKKVALIKTPTLLHRRHQNNTSPTKSGRTIIQRLKDRYYYVLSLLKFYLILR